MPAFYTHYRFGCDVLKQLPEDIRSICTAHRGLFDIGLHGPDIYFFYRPVLRISTGFCATLRWILSATRTSTRR